VVKYLCSVISRYAIQKNSLFGHGLGNLCTPIGLGCGDAQAITRTSDDIRLSNASRLEEIRQNTLARLAAQQNSTPAVASTPVTRTPAVVRDSAPANIRVASLAIEVPRSEQVS